LMSKDVSGASVLAERYELAEKEAKNTIAADQTLKKPYGKFDISFSRPLNKALPVPDRHTPLFVFCGTDLRNGKPFYFTQKGVGELFPDYRLTPLNHLDMAKGESKRLSEKITLAQAIAASSAFPLAFQPLSVAYKSVQGAELRACISDGGDYDNLGLDPILDPNIYLFNEACPKELAPMYDAITNEQIHPTVNMIPHRFIFVSNAGKPLPEVLKVSSFPPVTTLRVIDIETDQVTRIRERLLNQTFSSKSVRGASWQLDDLWKYYYSVKTVVDDKKTTKPARQNTDVVPTSDWQADQIPGDNTEERRLTVDQECEMRELLVELPKKGYPHLLSLFGLGSDFEVQDAEAWQKAYNIITKITSIRTDLDAFQDKESRVIELLGYILSAYNLHLFCPEGVSNPLKLPTQEPPFPKDFNTVNIETLSSALTYSDCNYLSSLWHNYWNNKM